MKERMITLFEKFRVGAIDKIAYFYLLLPVLIFSIFWLEWYYAIIAVFLFAYLFYRISFDNEGRKDNRLFTAENRKKWIIILCILTAWVALSGIGKLVYQNPDHSWRNTMFETLCHYRWPVTGLVEQDGIAVERGFSYYIGFWLPAALLGKIFGTDVGYFFQVIWAIIGVLIFYYKICEKFQKVLIWPLAILILFSGVDTLGAYLTGFNVADHGHTLHIEWWCGSLQFSSFTTQLFWVYNQAIPAWVATLILFTERSNKRILLIFAALLLNGTMPAIGLLPFMALRILRPKYHNQRRGTLKWWKYLLKEICTLDNVIAGLMSIITFLYLKRDTGESLSLFRDISNGGWFVCIFFLLMEIGVYVILCYEKQKRKPWFWVAFLWLCVCPFIQVYGDKNFCMRGCIPALVILMFYVIKTIYSLWMKKESKKLIALLVVLLIGAVTPVHEINRTIAETKNRYWQEEPVEAESLTAQDVLSNEYESVNVEDSFFFQYLAQKKEK